TLVKQLKTGTVFSCDTLWRIMKKIEMIKKILILIIFCKSFSSFGQVTDLIKLKTIDSLVSIIRDKPNKEDCFEISKCSGLITKKKFLFFKKQVGNFHENVIYKNGTIYLIKKFTNLENTSTAEYYYYNNDKLIYYIKKLEKFDEDNLISKNKIFAYFDSKKLIKITGNLDFDRNEILNKSQENKSDWEKFITQTEYK